MAKSKPSAVSDPGKQTIEELRERYRQLYTKKIQADTQLTAAKSRLEELKKEAMEKFGTADVAELQRKLEQMHQENEEKRGKYQADLDQIESELATVEEEFAAEERAADVSTEQS